MHHVRNGFFAERLEDGRVRLVKTTGARPTTETGATMQFEELLTAAEWASLVACVSARGEDGVTWREALDLHERKAPPNLIAAKLQDPELKLGKPGVMPPVPNPDVPA